MGRRRLALVMLLWLVGPPPAHADQSQFYFVAKVDAVPSIANTSGAQRGVYLRWGPMSGGLPAGLVQFIVHRGDQPNLATLPVAPLLGPAIDALYAPPEQSRRRAQVIDWLAEEAVAEGGPVIDGTNFAAEIASKIDGSDPQDAPWRILGARIDFNLARASNLGFLDTTAPLGPVEYELVGDYGGGNLVRLGHVVVGTAADHVLPAPDDLAQVRLGRCDAPERSKDHAALALNWNHPGQALDEFRNSLLIAGYDVHCTEDTAALFAARDLRAEAALLGHDGEGNVAFTGLRKLNDQPVVISGQADTFERTQGFQEAWAQLQFSPQETAALGMLPGETYACHVTTLDVTGSYGQTAGLLVTIPDVEPPPAPWTVERLTDTPGQQLKLWWDHVDVINYQRKHSDGRSFCNLDDAIADGELRMVPGPDDSCDGSPQIRVPLDVDSYLVYRFDDWNDAKRFRDSDGDGRGDFWEQVRADNPVPNPGVPICDGVAGDCLTLPGTACDDTQFPANPLIDYKIFDVPAAPNLVVRPDGRRVIELFDPVPAQNPGQVYWYVVVSRGANGNLSRPSAPVRAFFPDRTRPDTSGYLLCEWPLSERYCGTRAELAPWTEPFGTDASTAGRARFVRVLCGSPTSPSADVFLPIDPDSREAVLPETTCNAITGACIDGMDVSYLDDGLGVLGQISVPFTGCPAIATRLVDDLDSTGQCLQPQLDPLDPGETPKSSVQVGCDIPQDQCVTLFRRVDGEQRRLKTVCAPADPLCVDGFLVSAGGGDTLVEAQCPPDSTRVPLPNLDGGPVCLSFATVNENNVSSAQVNAPCFPTAAERPGIPIPLGLDFPADADTGQVRVQFSWERAEGRVLGTALSLRVSGVNNGTPDGVETVEAFAEHGAVPFADGPLSFELDVDVPDPVGDEEQRWCFRARSVGSAPPTEAERALSDFSQELCQVYTPAGPEQPTYLGWPEVPAPPEGESLLARYLIFDGVPVVRLAPLDPCISISACDEIQVGEIVIGASCFGGNLFDAPPTPPDLESSPSVDAFCPNPFCAEIAADLSGQLFFVPYRQERDGPGQPESEFIQVGPLVDRYHCELSLSDPLIKAFRIDGDPDFDPSQLVWVDRFPHLGAREFRYQFVYLDRNGEIIGYRTSNWVTAP